jgi:hypothetical protein
VGLFGIDDQPGMLNLLTPDVVAAAATEIQRGIRISRDWPRDKRSFPTNGRKVFEHWNEHHPSVPMNDDDQIKSTWVRGASIVRGVRLRISLQGHSTILS